MSWVVSPNISSKYISQCKGCNYQATKKGDLKKHQDSVHQFAFCKTSLTGPAPRTAALRSLHQVSLVSVGVQHCSDSHFAWPRRCRAWLGWAHLSNVYTSTDILSR